MKPFLRRIVAALACGYILGFFSEFYFVNDELAGGVAEVMTDPHAVTALLVELTLWYGFFAYIFLAAVGLFHVRSIWALILAAALYGWAVEGIIIAMMYESLPWSIAWTSLGWHVLVDVLVGWYLLRRVLHKNNYLLTAIVSIGFGLFWGVWATWYWLAEFPEVGVPLLSAYQFVGYAFVLTVCLILAFVLLDKVGGTEFKPSIVEMVLLIAWASWTFYWSGWANAPVAVYVLPPLYAAVCLALWRNRRKETRPDILASFTVKVRPLNYALLLLMPIAAVPVYALLWHFEVTLPIVYLAQPLMWIGTAVTAVSFILCLTGKQIKPRIPAALRAHMRSKWIRLAWIVAVFGLVVGGLFWRVKIYPYSDRAQIELMKNELKLYFQPHGRPVGAFGSWHKYAPARAKAAYDFLENKGTLEQPYVLFAYLSNSRKEPQRAYLRVSWLELGFESDGIRFSFSEDGNRQVVNIPFPEGYWNQWTMWNKPLRDVYTLDSAIRTFDFAGWLTKDGIVFGEYATADSGKAEFQSTFRLPLSILPTPAEVSIYDIEDGTSQPLCLYVAEELRDFITAQMKIGGLPKGVPPPEPRDCNSEQGP